MLDLFNTNLADDKSLKQLAKIVNTTERTLMRRAIKSLGMSLMEWKLRLRVVKATAMLNQGFSVERTALELGYSSSSAFISMFRKLMGVTPGEFRHQRKA
ncbi:AraC family transcriptional regulator [Orbus wheelerorum]|uniref:helix-turn-helix domain-containing protein n=1 Tax=Orbus wheelerorum TaxID=3074111 RepID=UPI00370DBAB2